MPDGFGNFLSHIRHNCTAPAQEINALSCLQLCFYNTAPPCSHAVFCSQKICIHIHPDGSLGIHIYEKGQIFNLLQGTSNWTPAWFGHVLLGQPPKGSLCNFIAIIMTIGYRFLNSVSAWFPNWWLCKPQVVCRIVPGGPWCLQKKVGKTLNASPMYGKKETSAAPESVRSSMWFGYLLITAGTAEAVLEESEWAIGLCFHFLLAPLWWGSGSEPSLWPHSILWVVEHRSLGTWGDELVGVSCGANQPLAAGGERERKKSAPGERSEQGLFQALHAAFQRRRRDYLGGEDACLILKTCT